MMLVNKTLIVWISLLIFIFELQELIIKITIHRTNKLIFIRIIKIIKVSFMIKLINFMITTKFVAIIKAILVLKPPPKHSPQYSQNHRHFKYKSS